MIYRLQGKISKEELIKIIDGLHLQMAWVWLCLDSLEAIKSIDKNEIRRAQNFMYITHSSLIYRYSMELAKLFDEGEAFSINQIRNMCINNKEYFDADFDVCEYCRKFKKEIKEYNSTIENLRERRNKTYAHNDRDYYLFSQKAIDDFPIDMKEIEAIAQIIYDFAKRMQKEIGSGRAHLERPANSDDVKRLFGLKTDVDKLLEEEW